MNWIKTSGIARIQFLIAAMAMLGMVHTASAALILSDDFESYTSAVASTSASGTTSGDLRQNLAGPPETTPGWDALRATIKATSTSGTPPTPPSGIQSIDLFPDPLDASNQTVRRRSVDLNSGRIDRFFDGAGGVDGSQSPSFSTTQIFPTAANPLSVKWRFYDSGGTGTPLPLDILSVGGAPGSSTMLPGAGTPSIGVGLIPTLNGRTLPSVFADNTKYQASLVAGSNSGPSFNLATSRLATPGWVTFELRINDTTGTLYVNGAPDANFNNLPIGGAGGTVGGGGGSYGRIRLGQIQGHAAADALVSTFALWDDIMVNTIPEPSCLVMSVSGLACLALRRRRTYRG